MTRARFRRLRAGFSLLTTLVVLAVVITLGAVVAVNLRGYERQSRLTEDMADLLALETALSGMVQASGRYPLQLSHTAQPPTAVTDKNSCGLAWSSGWTSDWQNKSPFGPFYKKRIIPIGTGWQLEIGVAMDTLVRSTTPATLTVRIPSVRESDAVDLDLLIDGTTNNRTAGKVIWSAPVNGFVDTLKFVHTRTSGNC